MLLSDAEIFSTCKYCVFSSFIHYQIILVDEGKQVWFQILIPALFTLERESNSTEDWILWDNLLHKCIRYGTYWT